MTERSAGSMMGGFLLGAVVGAGVALVLAPMAGKDTRRHIGDAARRLKDGAQGGMDNVVGAIKEGAGDIGAAIDAGKDAYRRNANAVTAPKDKGVHATMEGRTS